MKTVELVVLDQADRFAAAADGNLHAIENDRTCSQRNRLKSGRALAIDSCSGHAHRKSSTQQRLSCDVGAGGTLLHGAPHHNVLDFGTLDVGP